MAEQAIGVAIERLILFLAEEAVSIYGLREQVEIMQDKLEWIRCFLKDADGRSAGNESIKNWVNQIHQVAYDIEDVVDIFLVEVESYYNREDWKGKTKKYINKLKELIGRRKISSQIEKINKKMEEITRSREDLGIRGTDEGGYPRRESLLETRRRNACEDREHDVVGLEEKINELVKRLVEGEGRRCVISVVGKAGIGKTVLARKVYNCAKSSFTSAAWVHVSKHNPNEVLRELCKAILRLPAHETEKLDEGEMRERIANQLKGKTYLVVLDDVWENVTWDAIRGAFPDENTRSRVLMTAQYSGLAEHADMHSPLYSLPLLNQGDSCELLCRHRVVALFQWSTGDLFVQMVVLLMMSMIIFAGAYVCLCGKKKFAYAAIDDFLAL